MIKLDVKADKTEAEEMLRSLGVESKWLSKNLLRALASGAKKWIKGRMGGFLHNRLGELKKSVYGFLRSNDHAVVSTGRGYMAEILERGGTIHAKKGGFLAFLSDSGAWVKTKSVTIPAKRWFSGSIAGFEGSNDERAIIDKQIANMIKRATR